MRRLSRIAAACFVLSCLVAPLALSLTPASAATRDATAGGSSSSRALGARRPTTTVKPKQPITVGGISAQAALPTTVNLRQWAVAPGNQGSLNSCVPWTIDYAMLGWYSRFSGRAGQPFAPMYTYSQIHLAGDGGSYPTDALKLAVAQGVDTRADYKQGDFNYKTPPTPAERTNATRFRIKGFTTLFQGANQSGAVGAIKQALATSHPVAIEVAVRKGFENIGAAPTAVDDDITSKLLGYHEVLAVGYDAAGLIVESSWGATWAGDGFGRISWRVVQHDLWEADTIDGFAPAPTVATVKKQASIPSVPALPATTPHLAI
jgi:hypothetical protein